MASKRFIHSALAYVLLTFPLAYAWHLIFFRDLYERLGYFGDQEPVVALGFLAIAIQAVVLAYAYPFFTRGIGKLRDGLRFGAVFGLFLTASQVIAAAAKHHAPVTAEWFAIETVYMAVQFSLIGIAFALIHRSRTN